MTARPVLLEQIEAAVVRVLAAILGRTEDEVRNDDARWAAYQWDDGFVDAHLHNIEWDSLAIDSAFHTEDWVFGRDDVDVANSIFTNDSFEPGATTDLAARELFERQPGHLYGKQFAKLIQQDRIRLEQLDFLTVYSRIASKGESLIEAATGMFMLNSFPGLKLIPSSYAEVAEEWIELVDSIEPPELAAHIGMFLQSAESARCVGAAFSGVDDGTLLEIDGEAQQEIVASWWIGEGQGSIYLARILEDSIPEVPDYRGRELLTRPAHAELPENSRLVSSSEEILEKPLREHLENSDLDAYRELLDDLGDRDEQAFLAGMAIAMPDLWRILLPVDSLARDGNAHAALAVLHAARHAMTPENRRRTELRWAQALHRVGCHLEAVVAFQHCVEIGHECSEYHMPNMGRVHNEFARAALDAGMWKLALQQGEEALAYNEDLIFAEATRACALYELGRTDEAFEAVERVMRYGVDPMPQLRFAEDERYRELALENSIPVPVS